MLDLLTNKYTFIIALISMAASSTIVPMALQKTKPSHYKRSYIAECTKTCTAKNTRCIWTGVQIRCEKTLSPSSLELFIGCQRLCELQYESHLKMLRKN